MDTARGRGTPRVTDCLVGIVCIPDRDPVWLRLLSDSVPAWRDIELIAVLGPGVIDDPSAREFIASYCADYQTQPISIERLLFGVGHARGMARIEQQSRGIAAITDDAEDLVGESQPIRQLRQDLDKIAKSDAPVLVTGESGTGKELVARKIHACSTRSHQPFLAVNCVSLSPTLIHAELFGHEKGAFTGAHERKIGHLEAAHHGTIFLDEIGDLDAPLQAVLLRFLEEKTVRRVGGRAEVPVDVRVITATHVDIEAAVRAGRFREDLYYRLNVLRLHMPPLRERPGDAVRLAQVFLGRFGQERLQPAMGLSAAATAAIAAYAWPGNVRELINRIRRAVVMAEGRLISTADLQLGDPPSGSLEKPDLAATRRRVERQTVLAALDHAGGRAATAAKLLGVSRATLYRLLARYGIAGRASGGQHPSQSAYS